MRRPVMRQCLLVLCGHTRVHMPKGLEHATPLLGFKTVHLQLATIQKACKRDCLLRIWVPSCGVVVQQLTSEYMPAALQRLAPTVSHGFVWSAIVAITVQLYLLQTSRLCIYLSARCFLLMTFIHIKTVLMPATPCDTLPKPLVLCNL